MVEAFAWGLLASSSLVVGGVLAMAVPVGRRTLGLVLGFGAGVLISALAYDLVGEAVSHHDGGILVGVGLAAGALVFYAGDHVIDGMGGAGRKRADPSAGQPLAILLGIVLDGIPESIVIGVGLTHGEGVTVGVLVAVFVSNIPEAVAATTGLVASGWTRTRVLALWVAVSAVSAVAALVGYSAFDGAGDGAIAVVLAFAAGAILTMLSDTMIPEAYAHGGKAVGLVTTFGFGVAIAVSALFA